jgi:hypothetical protein
MDKGITGNSAVLAMSATLLGLTVQLTRGHYSPGGVAVVAVVLVLLAIATFGHVRGITGPVARKFLASLAIVQLFSLLFTPYGESLFDSPNVPTELLITLFLVASGAVIAIVVSSRRAAVIGFILLLTSQAAIGIWRIHSLPNPPIDVYVVQTEAANALSRGEDPYAMTYPNIFGPDVDFYPPGSLKDGRVQYGYPYPPLPMLLTTPAHLLLGDVRYAHLLAILCASSLIALVRSDRIGLLFGALFLFLPPGIYVLQMSWIEPISALFLVQTLYCALRKPGLAWLPLGLLLATKQYMPVALLLLPLMAIPWKRTAALLTVALAMAVTLPMALWNIPAFVHSAISFHLRSPYRSDALSFQAWWGYERAGWTGPSWPAFVAMGFAMAACLRWAPRRSGGFAMAIAFCFLVFFSLSKQAFANYYYLILAACCAAACLENWIPTVVLADKQLSDHAEIAHPDLLADHGLAGAGAAG